MRWTGISSLGSLGRALQRRFRCGRHPATSGPSSRRQGASAEALEARRLLSVPLGGELHVNTQTLSDQRNVAAAMDADGDFVLTWDTTSEYDQSYIQDGSGAGVYAQRYNSAGVPQGSEFQVNTYTTGDQGDPSVAMNANGDFIITWTSAGQDGDSYGVYAQRYNSAGVAQGSEFRVNTYTTGKEYLPSAAMDADGDFVITWSREYESGSYSYLAAYAQRYNAAGVAQGTEFRVNTYTSDYQTSPSAAMDADGDFVIAWSSFDRNGDYDKGVYAQRYSAAGVAQGGELHVNTETSDDQDSPSVAMDASGDFVIAWRSYVGQNSGVHAQRYNSAGLRQGGEFQVNTETFDEKRDPAVAMDADGDFVITWESGEDDDESGQDGSYGGVYAQKYNAAGVPQGGEFRVNTYTTDMQEAPAVAMDADGNFMIAWDSEQEIPFPGFDNRDYGIYAQRFGEPSAVTLVDGLLTVTGTDSNDSTSVRLVGSTLVVTRNGTARNFSSADVSRIEVYGLDGNDTVIIGPGVIGSYVLGGNGNDTLTGGDGNDALVGASGKDRLTGGGGDDRVAGGKHGDILFGGDGNDRIYGDEANDLMDGGAGRDRMYGGDGGDTMLGGNQNDTMYGEAGNDSLRGGNHSDRLFPGFDSDTADGGAGDDIAYLVDGEIDTFFGGLGINGADSDLIDHLSGVGFEI